MAAGASARLPRVTRAPIADLEYSPEEYPLTPLTNVLYNTMLLKFRFTE
jgi:hypothetical protein